MALKNATDLQSAGAQNNNVIAYNAANNDFYVTDLGSTLTSVDGGYF